MDHPLITQMREFMAANEAAFNRVMAEHNLLGESAYLSPERLAYIREYEEKQRRCQQRIDHILQIMRGKENN